MNMITENTNPLVAIGDISLSVIEYRGKRVVTFAMVDQVHQRPERTAFRNFHSNRERFVEEEDFHLVDFSQMNEFRSLGIDIPPRGLGVMATEVCRKLGIRTGRVPDERWGTVNSYPVEVLQECLATFNNESSAA